MDKKLKILIGLTVVVGAIGVAAATGAFTVVQAERTAQVDVAGDSNALLALNGSQSPYVNEGGDGAITIQLSNTGQNAGGVNARAVTDFGELFTIENQGTQDVAVWIVPQGADYPDRAHFYTTSSLDSAASHPTLSDRADHVGSQVDGSRSVISNSTSEAVVLGPGDSITVGLYVDLWNVDNLASGDEILSNIQIIADSDESGTSLAA